MRCPCTLISINRDVKILALFDYSAKVNVMICKVMAAAHLDMRKKVSLELVIHTNHYYLFLGVYKNMTINVRKLVIQTPIFIIITADHLLVLGQPYLYKKKFSQQYLSDSVYGHLTDYTETYTIAISILSPKDKANWKKKDLFQFQSLKV